jgi:hypothetical protein
VLVPGVEPDARRSVLGALHLDAQSLREPTWSCLVCRPASLPRDRPGKILCGDVDPGEGRSTCQ